MDMERKTQPLKWVSESRFFLGLEVQDLDTGHAAFFCVEPCEESRIRQAGGRARRRWI